jgi:two-component system cell cycle response regulator DivK
MDIDMPVMDGYEAIRELRADESTRAIPTIAVTAFAMDDDRKKAMDAGFDGYITKPIRTRTFAAAVEALRTSRRGK